MPGEGYQSHTVEQGEDIISIAEKYRISADSIWNDAANGEIRELRENPFVLFPGDVLAIPPMKPKRVPIETDKLHTFRRKGVPEKLILNLRHNDKPRVRVRYLLEVEKRRMPGVTDADGKLEHWVRPADRQATLRIMDDPPEGIQGPEVYELLLGHLDPIDTDSGLRSRLVNLGFLFNPDAAGDELRAALEAFQSHCKLRVTGRADEKTRAKLLELHKS